MIFFLIINFKKLMNRDPEKRLGVKDINEIKNHPLFNNYDWKKIIDKKITPPQITIENNVNFDKLKEQVKFVMCYL